MSASFASQEWVEQLGAALSESATVRTNSMDWVFGPLLFVIDADEEHGLAKTALRVDLHEGSVRGVTLGDAADATRVPFAVGGSLARWKAVFGGSLSIVDGILESKLRSRGDLPTLARHRQLLDGIAAAGGSLETQWQDDEVPASASAG